MEEWPPVCPKCYADQVEYIKETEYTGGGFSDIWYEFICKACGHEWRSETSYQYA